MKPFLTLITSSLFLTVSLLISGCVSDQPPDLVEKKAEPTDIGEKRTENDTPTSPIKNKPYLSVTDYSEEINGHQIKNSLLKITRKDNIATLEMTINISDYLIEKLLSTEKPYYFTFGDMLGEKTITNLLIESPSVVTIVLNRVDNNYIISQQLKLKENLTHEEEQALLSPKNYVFQVLNEEKLAVSTFIGLEIATIINDQ